MKKIVHLKCVIINSLIKQNNYYRKVPLCVYTGLRLSSARIKTFLCCRIDSAYRYLLSFFTSAFLFAAVFYQRNFICRRFLPAHFYLMPFFISAILCMSPYSISILNYVNFLLFYFLPIPLFFIRRIKILIL
jgi:hypothetical protein